MNSYRVDLELRSGVSTPLAADTLWGHIAWGIRYHEGETSLRSWLERYDDGEPPIVLSDPVPAGWWPAPTLPPPATPAAPPTLKEADLQKQRSRRAWVCHKDWNSVAGGLSAEAMLALPISSPEAGVRVPIAHAAINRLSNGTAQEGGGTLYTRRRTFFADPNRFDVWVLADAPADTIRQWFNWGLLGGYGKHASSGAGHLVVCGVYEESFPTPSKPNAGLLLAAATPTKSDPHKGFVSIGVRCGRLGGLF
ncbi:MAG TPA: hypothetical protein ENJ50_02475, partial [Planctomycetaceae bacterium]|nr:hypothetical protein [Planctomycetaceae bacterium]